MALQSNTEHLTRLLREQLADDYGGNVYSLEQVADQIASSKISIMDYYLSSWELSVQQSKNN